MIFLKTTKKIISVLLTVLIMMLPLAQVSSALIVYPIGVTRDQAVSAIEKTDSLIANLFKQMNNSTLAEMVLPELYKGDMLGIAMVEVYKAIDEQGATLNTIGIDTSVANVAANLTQYPDVYNKLITFSTWEQADLSGVNWGLQDKYQFADAISAMLTPFNDILYSLFCGEKYSLNFLIGFKGDMGYENAIVPLLSNIGCDYIKDAASFYSDASVNKASMMSNIVLDLIYFVEEVLAAPASKLTEKLPNLAYFLNNGSFSQIISDLIEPAQIQILSIGSNLLNVGVFSSLLSFIENPSDLAESEDLDDMLTGFLGEDMDGLQMAPLDLDVMASCGEEVNGKIVANKADSFMVIMRFLVDTLKLNKDMIQKMTTQNNAEAGDILGSLDGLFDLETDKLITVVINLLTSNEGVKNDFKWEYSSHTNTPAVYTANLDQADFQRMIDGIDPLLDEMLVEFGGGANLSQTVSNMIYSNDIVSAMATMIYPMLTSEEVGQILGMIDISLSPASVAKNLIGDEYTAVKSTLEKATSWEELKDKELNWGFKNGDKAGFIKAVTGILTPMLPIINMAFAEGNLKILGAIDLYGSNAYETAIIPLLENLGVKSENIKTYAEYKLTASSTNGISDILDSLCSLIDELIEKPIYTFTSILPNLVYFLQNKGVTNCINNILYPISAIAENLGMEDAINSVMLEFTDIDILSEITNAMPEFIDGLSLKTLDLVPYSGYGTLEERESKATYAGMPTKLMYVKADQPAVIMTLMRFLVDMMKAPGNGDFLDGLLAGATSSNEMFASFAGEITTQLNSMGVDETIEWIFNLFFKERVTVEEDDDADTYVPDIVYKEETETNPLVYVAILIILVALAVIAFLYRDKIMLLINKIKNKKQQKEDQKLS